MLSVILTFVLPNSLEDLLAIAVGGLIGYAALLNLPLRRNEAKEKLRRVATNFVEVHGSALLMSLPSLCLDEILPHQSCGSICKDTCTTMGVHELEREHKNTSKIKSSIDHTAGWHHVTVVCCHMSSKLQW